MRSKLSVCALALVCAFAIVCAPAPASDAASIYDTLAASKDTTIFFVAVKEAEDVLLLKGQAGVALVPSADACSDDDGCGSRAKPIEYTLFAPTDAAFKKLDDDTIRKIATDTATVKRLIRAHLVVGKFTTEELKKYNGKDIPTLAGTTLKVEALKDGFRVGGAKLVEPNVGCSNGVIHVVDGVLPIPKK